MLERTICITPGDPTGIGPEITVKFLKRVLKKSPSTASVASLRIIGSLSALEEAASSLNLPLPESSRISYIDIVGNSPGETSFLAIEHAVEELAMGRADALVTGPIAKKNLKDAGIISSGHTEILEILARRFYSKRCPVFQYPVSGNWREDTGHFTPSTVHSEGADMLFVWRNFRMLLLTRHIPLSHVPSKLISQNIYHSMERLSNFLKEYTAIKEPRIAILGINPHAGEIGGIEETLILLPLIEQINSEGEMHLEGPFAADAFFRGFSAENSPYDTIVAAYHDQGLIPFKLIAGYKAVNVTIGLPFIRTSVSHGTAFDIAGRGIASEESLSEAVDTALALIYNREKQRDFALSLQRER